MQLALKTKLHAVALDLSGVADPAAELSFSLDRADGTKLTITVAAEASRTAGGLADALIAAIPAELIPHRPVSVTSEVSYADLGAADPKVTGLPATIVVRQEWDATLVAGAGALGGYLLG